MGLVKTSHRVSVLFFSAALLQAGVASAGIHTWNVNEVFSNADGSIQYVELVEGNGTPGETGVGNGTITSATESFHWTNGAVAPPTSNKFYLVASQSFAILPGAPTPDAIIPGGQLPFFNTAGDTVAFGGFDSWVFGAVPTNGTDSLDRASGVGANTPTNYAGATGTVDANVNIPTLSAWGLILLTVSLLAMMGFVMQRRRGQVV